MCLSIRIVEHGSAIVLNISFLRLEHYILGEKADVTCRERDLESFLR